MSVVNKNVVVLLQEILQVSLGVPQSRYVEVVLVLFVPIDESSCSSGVNGFPHFEGSDEVFVVAEVRLAIRQVVQRVDTGHM